MRRTQSVYLPKDLASKESGLSVRRLLELASAGRIRRIYRRDPKTNREIALFDAEEIRALGDRTVMTISTPTRAIAAMPQPIPADSHSSLWLTVTDAAAYVGLPEGFLVRLIRSGKLPAFDVGVRAGGRYRVSRKALEDLEAPMHIVPGKQRAK